MAFNVQEMRSQLVGGGARPSLFEVQLQNPVNIASDLKSRFMIRASQLPPSQLGLYELPYFGRKIKIAGDRVFPEWSVTIVNDEDFLIRNGLEQWMNSINTHEGNIRAFGTAAPTEYKSQAQVIQYSKTGDVLREYTFNGLFPTDIGAIELDWNSTDVIEEFPVVFQYDWWEVSGGSTGNSTAA